ncbi:MAG TPA: hypothetical protein VNN55_00775 [bacterium]|nr:hypothetical protein [bacterium]
MECGGQANRRIITALTLAAIAIYSVAAADEPVRRWLPRDLVDAADSARFTELSYVAQMIDSGWWSLYLQAPHTRQSFLSLIQRHQADHPEDWARAQAGLAWGRDSAHCGEPPWDPYGDVRWPFLLRYGPPSSWWETWAVTPTYYHRDTTRTWYYWWSAADRGAAFQAPRGDSIPRAALVPDRRKSEIWLRIDPVIELVSFPNRDSTDDVWIAVGVNGSDLNRESIAAKTLEIEYTVRDDQGHTIRHEQQRYGLGLTGVVLSVVGNHRNVRVPIHLCVPGLKPGHYELDLTVRGHRHNRGSVSLDFTVPSPLASRGMSDLLLAYTRGPRGFDLAPGVQRGGRNLYIDTEPVYAVGDTVFPYVEIAFPEGDDWSYAVSVYLRPVRAVKGTLVRTGRPVVVADSAETPLARWAGIDIRRELTVLGIDEPARPHSVTLLAARVYRGGGSDCVFESEFVINENVKSGEYWLTVEIEGANPQGRHLWRAAQKQIVIGRSWRNRGL